MTLAPAPERMAPPLPDRAPGLPACGRPPEDPAAGPPPGPALDIAIARNLPVFVREVLEEARAVRFETRRFRPLAPGAVALLSVMRNEAGLVAPFLAHYRGLGVDRFVVIDNGSTDGTAERLAAEPDVDLHVLRRPFRSERKQGWLARAIALYGTGRWYLSADADEHLVWPGMEAGLPALIARAEALGLRRLRGMLVDMYPEGPLFEPPAADMAARPLAARFPLFDAGGYAERVCKQRLSLKGGPRKRLFAARGLDLDPEMTKYPLFHIRPGEVFDNPHHLHPYAENFRSPRLLGLLHYKFHDGFRAKVAAAVAEGGYFNGSAEYRAYAGLIAEGGGLGLAHAGSRRYAGPADLVAAGLLAPLPGPAAAAGLLARARARLGL